MIFKNCLKANHFYVINLNFFSKYLLSHGDVGDIFWSQHHRRYDWSSTSEWDTCSRKWQLERTRSWKVLSWKVWSWKEPSEVGKNRLKLERTERSWKASFEVRKFRWSWKVSPKLERAKRNWKEPIEVGKNRAKLERTERSWKASFEVGKFRWSWKVSPQLESSGWSWKVWMNLESSDWCWEVHHNFLIRVTETYKLGLG